MRTKISEQRQINGYQDGSKQSKSASNCYPLSMKMMQQQQLQLIQLLQQIHQVGFKYNLFQKLDFILNVSVLFSLANLSGISISLACARVMGPILGCDTTFLLSLLQIIRLILAAEF